MRSIVKRFFIALSFLFCLFSSYLLDAYITILPQSDTAWGNVAFQVGQGISSGMQAAAQANMMARQQQQEHENYLAELRAQEEMMERERQRERAHQQYLAELELERIRQAEQPCEKTDKQNAHE
jgi:hypothetical protein